MQRALIAISDRLYDIRHGTDTARQVYEADLKPVGPNKSYAVKYQATVPGHFARLMAAIELSPGSGFVDFGSGKGRALLLASGYGFKRITGVEFDGELCAIAKKNVEIFLRRRDTKADVRILHLDATKYDIQKDDNVFYFFQPFRAAIMRPVLENIAQSLIRAPRRVWLVYYGVPHDNIVATYGIFSALARFNFSAGALWELPGPGRDSIVYVNTGAG